MLIGAACCCMETSSHLHPATHESYGIYISLKGNMTLITIILSLNTNTS